jgi:hypothetical protein
VLTSRCHGKNRRCSQVVSARAKLGELPLILYIDVVIDKMERLGGSSTVQRSPPPRNCDKMRCVVEPMDPATASTSIKALRKWLHTSIHLTFRDLIGCEACIETR